MDSQPLEAFVAGLAVASGHRGDLPFSKAVLSLCTMAGLEVKSFDQPDELQELPRLVSESAVALLDGSGLSLEDVGEHELKGVPGRRRVYRLVEQVAV